MTITGVELITGAALTVIASIVLAYTTIKILLKQNISSILDLKQSISNFNLDSKSTDKELEKRVDDLAVQFRLCNRDCPERQRNMMESIQTYFIDENKMPRFVTWAYYNKAHDDLINRVDTLTNRIETKDDKINEMFNQILLEIKKH